MNLYAEQKYNQQESKNLRFNQTLVFHLSRLNILPIKNYHYSMPSVARS